jgi:phosphoribosylformylglycinamidine (FGAM) synthase-like enzyme
LPHPLARPISALIDPVAGSRNAIAESLSNLVWAPLKEGLDSVSLSANWMWACKMKVKMLVYMKQLKF